MKHGLARLRFALAHPQWLPLLAASLALLASAMHLIMLPGREAAIAADEERLSRLERATRRQQIAQQSAPSAQPGQGLLERFPAHDTRHTLLGRLLESANQAGLQVSTGEYRLTAGQDKLFERYQLNLPLAGSYPEIRRYLATIRSEFPTLAIDDISLRREKIGDAELGAQLRLIILTRRPEAR